MQSNGVPGWRRMMDEGTRLPYDARLARARAPEYGKVMSTLVELWNVDWAATRQLGHAPPTWGATQWNTRGGVLAGTATR